MVTLGVASTWAMVKTARRAAAVTTRGPNRETAALILAMVTRRVAGGTQQASLRCCDSAVGAPTTPRRCSLNRCTLPRPLVSQPGFPVGGTARPVAPPRLPCTRLLGSAGHTASAPSPCRRSQQRFTPRAIFHRRGGTSRQHLPSSTRPSPAPPTPPRSTPISTTCSCSSSRTISPAAAASAVAAGTPCANCCSPRAR